MTEQGQSRRSMRTLLGPDSYSHYLDCGDSFLDMIIYFGMHVILQDVILQ